MEYSINEIATIIGIRNKDFGDFRISELTIDSRKIITAEKSLFFALETKQNDAHKFIHELYLKGVRNFVVAKILDEWNDYTDANFLKVSNPLRALQKLAGHHRKKFSYPVIGITGSNGKTIVKEWLYQLLSEDFNIVRSPRSYNSQIGVPLSVWEMSDDNNLAIFEAGISQVDEMSFLEQIIQPTIGVFTKLGEAHQENFTSLQQKSMEKLSLFSNCDMFVYDEDNRIINQSIDSMVLSQKSFAWSRRNHDAPLFIVNIKKGEKETHIQYSFLHFDYSVTVPFVDDASIENSISCLAVMLYLNIAPSTISERMKKLEPVAMRLDVREGKNSSIIINDTYNSDINSIKIALEFQNQRRAEQNFKKTLIISDILQTGIMPKSLYKRVAELIQHNGIDKLIGIGVDISHNRDIFEVDEKYFFQSTDNFIESGLWKNFKNEIILLKGARKYHFEEISALIEKRTHETVLEVNLDSIVHNFNKYKSLISPDTKLVCMVKADGYGSGAIEIAKTLQYHRCEYFAVAVAEEGIKLRKEGISSPIIVLNPETNGFEELFSCDLEPEVYNFRILEAFIKEAERRGVTNYPIHIKIDTGMHRLGFLPSEISQLIDVLKSQKGLKVKSIFSHLAASESWVFDDFTKEQIDLLNDIHSSFEKNIGYAVWKHILNSAGIERFPDAQWSMVRLGIGLYGVNSSGNDNGLENVFTLKSTVLQIKTIPSNETVGYGRKETTTREARIATIRIGYADGLNRNFGNRKGKVLINGQFAPIVGSVCMDLCMVDVTDIKAKEGDEVIIFGKDIPVTELASTINTIPYEILTSISSRVKRIYIKE